MNKIFDNTAFVYDFTNQQYDNYWILIYPNLLELYFNEAGLEYDKTYSNSDVVTPDQYPIVLKTEKKLIKTKPKKQRLRNKY